MTDVRSPAVAGQFYESTQEGLREQIEASFGHRVGPGEITPVAAGPPEVRALVSPHAGYPYSGPVAAHAFGALGASGRPDAVVIVGPNHGGRGEAIAVTEADQWQTPLGRVPVHDGLRDRLLEASAVVADERTHAGEHSLEVQVPFLQYLYGEVPILPLAMTRQDESTVERLAGELRSALEAVNGTVPVIASTDFTHYEPQDVAKRQDQLAIDRIEALDGTRLLDTVAAEGITMCGYGPTAVAIETAKGGGATEGELLKYATSGDTAGSPREVVGYAAVAIR